MREKRNANGERNGVFFDDSFRIYFIPEICFLDSCGGGYLLGYSEELPSNNMAFQSGIKSSILVFDKKLTSKETSSNLLKDNSTVPHELLHSIGLSHTFDEKSKYIFEQFMTDNIMDYVSRESKLY